jgi:hypothetical protein
MSIVDSNGLDQAVKFNGAQLYDQTLIVKLAPVYTATERLY